MTLRANTVRPYAFVFVNLMTLRANTVRPYAFVFVNLMTLRANTVRPYAFVFVNLMTLRANTVRPYAFVFVNLMRQVLQVAGTVMVRGYFSQFRRDFRTYWHCILASFRESAALYVLYCAWKLAL